MGVKFVDKVIKQLEIKLKIKDSIEEVIANDNTAQETSRYGLLITKYYENEISCNYVAYTKSGRSQLRLGFFIGNQDEVVEMLRSEGNWEARLLDWAQEASKTFFMKNSD